MPRNPKTKIADPAGVRRALHAWFTRHKRDLPWRRDSSPYAVMVSEFMLQQTQVATVVPYFTRWMERFPTFASLAEATEEEVLSVWQGLGYYSRARRLREAALAVTEQLRGDVPRDPEAIAALPGIGRYTAGAIAAFAFDRAVPTVDANIARVLARMLDLRKPIDSGEGQREIWKAAIALLPARGGRLHNSALMELGALVCTARSPQCLLCPIRKHCASPEPEKLPLKRQRPKLVAIDEACGWAIHHDRILLEQQTGPRWRGLWKLPHFSPEIRSVPIFQTVYSFTNHRVTLHVHRMRKPSRIKPPLAWFELSGVPSVPLASPHRRAILKLLQSEVPESTA